VPADREASEEEPMLQRITHSECIYAPGDGELVKELFVALGFAVTKVEPYPYIIAHVDPDVMDVMSNVIYASELTEMQQAFEKTLQATLASSQEFREATDNWENDFRDDPQRSVHFGFQYESRDSFQATIDRLREASGPGKPLEGRLLVTGVYFPGDDGSITDTMAQGFVWTDVMASGILTFGQHLELQWHIEPSVVPTPA
jgi:hypothetical protein